MLVACQTCGLVQRAGPVPAGTVVECVRCASVVRPNRPHTVGRTAAFSLAALILYWPANVYPILRMDLYGVRSENTIFQGVLSLFEHDQPLVAVVVFLASIAIPLLKLLGLFYLVLTARWPSRRGRPVRTWIHRAIEVMGPWAMLDVFLLAILVALVKLGDLATVLPGPGLFAFTAVVVLTILASRSFDPAQIWDAPEGRA
jgi:paraquat-inducible protein A